MAGFILLGVLVLLGCLKYSFDREFCRAYRHVIRLPAFFSGPSAWLLQKLRARKPENPEEVRMSEALFLHEGERKAGHVRTLSLMMLVLMTGSLVCGILWILQETAEPVRAVTRPAFGATAGVSLQVDGLGRETVLDLSVSGRTPDREGLFLVFDALFEEMKPVWLNRNPSAEEVRTDLYLPDEAQNGVRFTYSSSDYSLMSNYGILTAEALPEEGKTVTLTIVMAYGDAEKSYELPLRLLPPKETVESAAALKSMLEELDRETAGDPCLVLPERYEDRPVLFRETTVSPYGVLLAFAVSAILLWYFMRERRKAAFEKRNRALEREYVTVVSKLSTLVSAGMSIRGAWCRIVENYRNGLDSGRTAFSYACEEMRITASEMETGAAETEAYLRFGRRCGLRPYQRFAGLLAQNVRQGISGLNETLKNEAALFLENRRNRALREAEKAETKQIFPMVLMLCVVVALLLIPALMSL